MPRLVWQNFNAGEVSKKLNGRTDFAKYFNSLESAENFVPLPQGPITRRPGLQYIATAKSATQSVRLVPFVFSVTQSYLLEFGHNYIRFYKDKAQILSGPAAYEIVSPYGYTELAALAFAQSNDVMYIVHPSYTVRKLSRLAHDSWTLAEVNFRPPGLDQLAYYPAGTLTLSAVSGTGVTATFSSSVMLNGYVGREIRSGSGRASITAFASATSVTVDIIDTFASVGPIASASWYLQGSPVGSVTPSAKEPEGSVITLTSSGTGGTSTSIRTTTCQWTASGSGTDEYYLTDLGGAQFIAVEPSRVTGSGITLVNGAIGSLGLSQWDWGDNDALGFNTVYLRTGDGSDPDGAALNSIMSIVETAAGNIFISADVGKYVTVNGGICKITAYTSATSVKAQILKAFDTIVADTAFMLLSNAWNSTDGYPEAVAFADGRLYFARGEKIWGSVIEDYENFTPGSEDDDAIAVACKADNIEWLLPLKNLVAGADDGVYVVEASEEGAITPSDVAANLNSNVQVSGVTPIITSHSLIFTGRARTHLFEAGYKIEADSVVSNQLDLLSDHLTRGKIKEMAYQQDPHGIVWCVTDDGELFSVTYQPAHEVVGFAPHTSPFSAIFISVAAIPGMSTDHDTQVWMAVKRYINGAWVQYIELMAEFFEDDTCQDAIFLDSFLTYDAEKSISTIEVWDNGSFTVTTGSAHSFSEGDYVLFSDDVGGMTELAGQTGVVADETMVVEASVAQGAVRASFTDTASFIWIPGVDLSDYDGVAGVSTPYLVELEDSAGLKARAYLAEQGAGETLSAEGLANPTFDSDVNNWTAYVSTLASIVGGQSNNCCELTRSSGDSQFAAAISSLPSKPPLNKLSVYAKSGTSGNETFRLIGAAEVYKEGTTTGSWVQHELYAMQDTIYTIKLQKQSATAGTMLFDEASKKTVTDGPALYSLRVVSAENGATQSWASIETGFDVNDPAGLTYRIIALSPTTTKFTVDASIIDASAYSAFTLGGSVRKKVSTVSGLTHLEGETVQVVGDGGVRDDEVVASGAITLSASAATVHVGGHYDSIAKTLRIASQEVLLGVRVNVVEMVIMFYKTLGGYAGYSEDALRLIEFRTTGDPLGSPPDVYDGEKVVGTGGEWVYGGRAVVKQAQPLPMTICAISLKVDLDAS